MMQIKKTGLRQRPFATALAVLLVFVGITSIFNVSLSEDALAQLIPSLLVHAFAWSALVAGLMLLISIALDRLNLEAAACVLILVQTIIRMIAMLSAFGVTKPTFVLSVFYGVFSWATAERLRQCLRGEEIVRVQHVVKLDGVEPGHDVTVTKVDVNKKEDEE